MSSDERRVAALLRERAGLVQRGLDERVAQVDEQIKAYGGEVPQEPEGRQAPPKSTADAAPPANSPKPAARRKAASE